MLGSAVLCSAAAGGTRCCAPRAPSETLRPHECRAGGVPAAAIRPSKRGGERDGTNATGRRFGRAGLTRILCGAVRAEGVARSLAASGRVGSVPFSESSDDGPGPERRAEPPRSRPVRPPRLPSVVPHDRGRRQRPRGGGGRGRAPAGGAERVRRAAGLQCGDVRPRGANAALSCRASAENGLLGATRRGSPCQRARLRNARRFQLAGGGGEGCSPYSGDSGVRAGHGCRCLLFHACRLVLNAFCFMPAAFCLMPYVSCLPSNPGAPERGRAASCRAQLLLAVPESSPGSCEGRRETESLR